MAQDGVSALFGITDAKIARLLTDNGAGTTYENPKDIPGIQSIQFSPEFLEKELHGDDELLDIYSKLKSLTGTVKHGKISLDVLALLMGGIVTDGGSSPNEYREMEVFGTSIPGYFLLEGQITYRGGDDPGGDWHVSFWKGKISKFQLECQGEDYAIVSFDYKAIPRAFDKKLFKIRENQTAVPILETPDTTPPTVTLTSPVDGADNVSVNASVVYTFSKALQAGNVNTGSFMLVKPTTGDVIACTVTYDGNGHTATIDPSAPLEAATGYMAFATREVRDTAGNRLAAPSVVNFTTAT